MPQIPAILIVESDAPLRKQIDATLRKQGWHTVMASGGVEALAAALNYDGPITLAIIDLFMPQLGGLDLANQLAADRPSTKILYMTGCDSVVLDSLRHRAPEIILRKPFSGKDLLASVRSILAAKPCAL